jgi:hypothetical protein
VGEECGVEVEGKEGIREEGLTRSEDFGGGVVQVLSEPWHRTHSMEADANDIFAPALAFPSSVLSDGPSPNGLQFFFLFRHSSFHWNCYILCRKKR